MKFWSSLILSVSILLSVSCGKEDRPVIDLETEQFTSFQMTFNPLGGGPQIIFGSEDLGDLGIAMAASSGPLQVNTTYDARLVLFNRKVEPGKNLTESVKMDGANYQLYVEIDPDNVFQTISYEDMDDNGNPIGLNMTFETSERFTVGNLRFILKRGVDKSAAYLPGQPVPFSVGGESLIDVNFEVIVQE